MLQLGLDARSLVVSAGTHSAAAGFAAVAATTARDFVAGAVGAGAVGAGVVVGTGEEGPGGGTCDAGACVHADAAVSVGPSGVELSTAGQRGPVPLP